MHIALLTLGMVFVVVGVITVLALACIDVEQLRIGAYTWLAPAVLVISGMFFVLSALDDDDDDSC